MLTLILNFHTGNAQIEAHACFANLFHIITIKQLIYSTFFKEKNEMIYPSIKCDGESNKVFRYIFSSKY